MKLEHEIPPQQFKSPYHKLAVNLHCTTSWFNRISSTWLAPYDLSLQQFNVLRILRESYPSPLRVSVVQERMIDRMSNVSRLLEKLRQKGYVERQACCVDRRAVDVCLTRQGLALLNNLETLEKTWLGAFETLTPEDVETLNSLLDKMRG